MHSVEDLNSVFEKVSLRTGYKLGHDTHFDAQNFELSEIRGRARHRLDFQPLAGGVIQVTRLTETYPFSPSMCLFLQSFLPWIPFRGTISSENIANISSQQSTSELEKRVEEIVQNAM